MEGTIYSIIPPLVAIVLCILLREAIFSLFLGILVGAMFIYGSLGEAFFRSVDTIIVGAYSETDHAINLFFTVLMGGMVEILNRSPSSRILLGRIAQHLKTRAKAMVVIWFSGLIFFIDDYANALIVGNSYRKLSDRIRISREKLAYLVDSTSAPITSLALVSTWIGFEISIIKDAIEAEGVTGYNGYGLFLSSIPYRFYPLLALGFGFFVAWMARDFGPMKRAEERTIARKEVEEEAEETVDHDPWHISVLIPIVVLLLAAFFTLGWDGYHNGGEINWAHPWESMISLLYNADPFKCILWSTMMATLFSFIIHIGIMREGFHAVFEHWLEGCKGMFTICVILILAWSIGDVCMELKTGQYVSSLFTENFDPGYLPLLTFLIAAAISFATGTSFGTMSILMPVALPLAVQIGGASPDIMYGTIGSVLGGAIFGDHCSPLSDTTILSAGASGCSVMDHVNTQLPYALVIAVVSTVCLLLVPIRGISPYILLVVGIVLIYAMIRLLGKKGEIKENL